MRTHRTAHERATTVQPRAVHPDRDRFRDGVVTARQLGILQRTAGNAAVGALVQRTIGDGHDLSGNRFKGNVTLEAVFDDERLLQQGASGLAVTILQQALTDAGFPVTVNGQFGPRTRQAVRAFQTARGLSGTAVNGIVNGRTMDLLDRHFLGHAPERAIAAAPGRALTEGTRALSDTERAALRGAVTTEQRAAGGRMPTFHRTIATDPNPYEIRIRDALNTAITGLHAQLVGARPPRTPANLMGGAEIDRVATSAKTVTDAVFGRYQVGPALAYGLNIMDQFDVRDAQISASPAAADSAAEWRVDKLLNGDEEIARIDQEHGAVQSRTAEAGLIAPIRTAILGARRAELLAIHRNWPGSAEGGVVHLQRYRGATAAANRDILYDLFGTVIHEYVHTLEHPTHVTFREAQPEQRGGFVLREGMTDYFAKMVWDGLVFDAPLRSQIEGAFHDPVHPTAHPIPVPSRYSEWNNAERAVGIIGIRNAMAAYFLGRTDLIRMR
ncbi:peptidoglycan-binding domain-containing protein [Amycolatopsis sp. NPDC004747]